MLFKKKGQKAVVYIGNLYGSPIALKLIDPQEEAMKEARTVSNIPEHPNICI